MAEGKAVPGLNSIQLCVKPFIRLDAAQGLLPSWEIWALECLLRRYVCGRLRVAAESSVEGAAAGW